LNSYPNALLLLRRGLSKVNSPLKQTQPVLMMTRIKTSRAENFMWFSYSGGPPKKTFADEDAIETSYRLPSHTQRR
jgi:hypothetical protein